jgi:cytochrome P450
LIGKIFSDGKFVPNDHVIPFGLGKRSCLGQSMAEKEFFIFFVGLLQQVDKKNLDPLVKVAFVIMEVSFGLVRSLLLSVTLGLSKYKAMLKD